MYANGDLHPIELVIRHCLERPDRPWHELRGKLEQVQELADLVRSSSEDLLYMARIADGTLDVRRTETTVGMVLGAVLPRLQRRSRAQRVEILSVQVDEAAPLFTDARLLAHALRQIVLRALDAGSSAVTITATLHGDCVRFVIIDSGVAMTAPLVARVQDELALSDLAHADNAELSDLPFLLAAHLCRVLGGHVEVQSSVGHGTRVALTLLS